MTPFRVVAADPAWQNDDQLPGPGRGAAKHYRTMTVHEICGLAHGINGRPIYLEMSRQRAPIADDALLALWRLSSMPCEALKVIEAWGFVPKTEVIWAKFRPCKDCGGLGRQAIRWRGRAGIEYRHCKACDGSGCGSRWFGMGRYTRAQHETCIIAARGKMASRIKSHKIGSIFEAPVPVHPNGRAIHSAKPPRFYTDVIEKLARGPYVELFARQRRDGWTTLGDQIPRQRKA